MLTSMLLAGGTCPCCFPRLSAPVKRTAFFADTPASKTRAEQVSRAVHMPVAGRVWLDGGTIVNPADGSVVEGMSVLMDRGMIVSLEKTGSRKAGISAERIDVTGKFIVPGYNDMHSHALELEDPSGSFALMLAEGVTGFRQMSGSPALLEQRRNRTLPLTEKAPALLEMPGTVLFPLNASTPEAAIAEVRQQKEQGADFVKVGVCGPAVFRAAMEEAERAGIPILGHLQGGINAAEASHAGFKSIEHLGPGDTVWIGCSTKEAELHAEASNRPLVKLPSLKIPFLRLLINMKMQKLLINPAAFSSPEDIARLQRALDTFSEEKCQSLAARFVADGSWQVPTLIRLRTQELAEEYENHPDVRYLPRKKVKNWRDVTKKFKNLPVAMRETFAIAYPRQLMLAKRLADAGVRMMTGSDGGSMLGPGLTLQAEFAELAKAGFSPLKILQMTTINAAEYLNRTDTMGTVASGRNADMVLLDANPLENVENLGRISGVVRAGFYYSKADLDALKERVAAGRGYLN